MLAITEIHRGYSATSVCLGSMNNVAAGMQLVTLGTWPALRHAPGCKPFGVHNLPADLWAKFVIEVEDQMSGERVQW